MNKMIAIFFICSLGALSSLHSTTAQNVQESDYTHSKKKSRKNRLRSKRAQSAAPILDKEATKKISQLETTCSPHVFHFQHEPTKEEKTLCLFLNKLEFTQDGIAAFFNHTFNQRRYGTEFLPHNFSHLVQFMDYGKQMNQPHEFFDGVIRLFNTKLKSASFVNSQAFETLLAKEIPILTDLFPDQELSLWKDIKKLLWQNFKNQFSFLKSNPMGFFEDISDQIIQKVKGQVTTPDKFRGTLLRFTAASVDKLAWAAEDQEQTWESFKTIGSQLNQLYEKNIINDPFDINELYWGLIERYCFFLELTGSKLSMTTIAKIKEDINTGTLQWLAMEEQEQGLETKMERLVGAIIETEAKIRMSEHGILTEILPV
jgi:hypothetical protein